MKHTDIAVIGAGPGGYPAAIRAAQLGAKVAIIEKERFGGTCLNWGCIPTKTLIASSDLYHRINHAKDLGINTGKTSFNYGAMVKRKDEVVEGLRQGATQLLKANKIETITGTASFDTRNRLRITGEDGDSLLAADHVIIATGATSAMPGFLPSSPRVVDSKAFLDMTDLPASLLVLGGGVIGCEFACMAAQLGAEVTIVEMLEDILLVLDRDIRVALRKHMENTLGIRVLTGEPLQKITVTKEAVTGTAGKEKLSADMMLVSVGRVPVTADLALARAGIEVTKSGHIAVDAYCRTSVASVYAIGDVTAGSTQLAHAATAQGITAAENACGQRTKAETLIPACIFTAPEVGSVGLTEQSAKEQGLKIATGKFPFAALGKARAANETNGFVKWVADAETDQLLGAHAVGPHATELISEAAVAIRGELTTAELGKTVHCHPTFSEAWMEAAHALHGTAIHASPRRRR